ncbi:MAG: GDSL-type esterase/lipase family protein [Candidatus Lernaella stagnicola]|nr:GDSL-type esterase/lipase family protein [Candidatus Lernaella stagnicola]
MPALLTVHLRRHGRHWLVLLGLLIVLELVLHVAMPEPVHTYFYGLGGEDWAEDPELFWVPVFGFADPLAKAERAASERLIYAFGGSILTNHKASTNFPDELAPRLPGWTVANFATGGYTSHQSLVLFRRVSAQRIPAVVIASHAFNDRGPGFAPDREMAARNHRPEVKALYWLSRSKIVQAWRRVMWRLMGYSPYAVNPQHPNVKRRVPLPEFTENLQAFVAETARIGARLVFCSQASLDPAVGEQTRPYFAVMQTLADANQHVFYFDVQPVVFEAYRRRLGFVPVFPTDQAELLLLHKDVCHYNDAGHLLIADHLTAFLKAEGIADAN